MRRLVAGWLLKFNLHQEGAPRLNGSLLTRCLDQPQRINLISIWLSTRQSGRQIIRRSLSLLTMSRVRGQSRECRLKRRDWTWMGKSFRCQFTHRLKKALARLADMLLTGKTKSLDQFLLIRGQDLRSLLSNPSLVTAATTDPCHFQAPWTQKTCLVQVLYKPVRPSQPTQLCPDETHKRRRISTPPKTR